MLPLPDTLKGLNDKEIEHIKELTNERPHLFGLPGEKLRATHLVTHKLITTTDTPIRVKRHSYPPAIKEEMQGHINKYLDERIIRPSDSSYSSMMWVVPKKSGKNGENRWSMVTDFRQLNEVTVGNSYQIHHGDRFKNWLLPDTDRPRGRPQDGLCRTLRIL